MSSHQLKRHSINFLYYLGGIAILLFFVSPLLWTLSISLKTIPELFSRQVVWWPANPQWNNYVAVFQNTNIPRNLLNSLILVTTSIVLVMLIAVPSAYGLSRFRFKSKQATMLLILVFQMMSPVVIVIPLYRMFISLGIYNQLWSLIIAYAAQFGPLHSVVSQGLF